MLATRGKRLVSAGQATQDARLGSLADRDPDAPIAGPDGTWGAAAEEIAPDVYLWSYAGASPEALADRIVDQRMEAVVWIAGALAAFGFGFAAFRWRRQQRPAPAPAPATGPSPSPTELLQLQMSRGNAAASEGVESVETRIGPNMTELAPSPGTRTATRSPGETPSRPMILPAPGLNPDKVFGAYYLLDKLAAGGMGEVFAAVAFGAEGFKRIFVVKRLRPELSDNSEVVRQFINEARLGAGLVHSNIIPIFDFGKVGPHYYLAEEYIQGRTLEALVARARDAQRPLALELTLFAVHEVLKALSYAHSRTDESGVPMGLVHRDISPQNIMVSVRGEVKLLDFGIAKLPGGPTQTRHGVVKGNMMYMAPEQARGHPVDARTDLFSLGLVIYRCVAGRPLYQGQGAEVHQLLLKAADGPTEEEWQRITALPDPVGRLLARALQPDPAMRFATADDFAAALPAPPRSSSASLAAQIQSLFGDELRREEQQINAAIQATTRKAAANG